MALPHRSAAALGMLVVTTDNIPGYQICQVFGQAMGVVGRTRNPFQEGVRSLRDGGGHPHILKRLSQWRIEAIEKMVDQARQLGGNAVVAMRFDHRNISDMWGDICAYGTAVLVSPVPAGPPATASSDERPRAVVISNTESGGAPLEGSVQ